MSGGRRGGCKGPPVWRAYIGPYLVDFIVKLVQIVKEVLLVSLKNHSSRQTINDEDIILSCMIRLITCSVSDNKLIKFITRIPLSSSLQIIIIFPTVALRVV